MMAEAINPAARSQRTVTNIDHELAQLQDQANRARANLALRRQDVLKAEKHLKKIELTRLVKKNEQLGLSKSDAQADAQTYVDSCAAELQVPVASLIPLAPLEPLKPEIDTPTEPPKVTTHALTLERIAQANAIARQHGTRLAFLCLSISDSRQINSTFGHTVGHEVIEQVTQILESLIREGDTVNHQGGNEFLLLLAELSQPSDAIYVADRIVERLSGPTQLGEHVLHFSTSIGLRIYPDDGEDAQTLISQANAAMRCTNESLPHTNTRHGEGPLDDMGSQSTAPYARKSLLTMPEHERRYRQLREANGKLVMAALNAQELQAAAEQAKAKQTQFLGVLAHELRHPLAPIRNAAAILARIPINEPRLAQLQGIIDRQVEHMSRLVSDLLDISRVDSGKLRLERKIIDMTDVIAEAIDTCRSSIEARKQIFNVQVPQCVLKIDGDPVRLSQVLSNLLDNASKYTPTGGVIGLSVWVEGDALVLTVSDNGIGITAEALPHVFEPFVQDIQATAFNGFGLGIGLTVVRELVKAHGGSVVASSGGSGLGSQFIVKLKLHEPPIIAAESLA